jgi:hypothetical protein
VLLNQMLCQERVKLKRPKPNRPGSRALAQELTWGGVVPGRELIARRSLAPDALEERAEEIVESYLRAGDQGDWRALDALVNRVSGKPKETVVSEQGDPDAAWKQELRDLPRDALYRIVHKNNPTSSREWRRTARSSASTT